MLKTLKFVFLDWPRYIFPQDVFVRLIVVVNVKSYSVFSGQRIILGDITAVFHLSSTFCLAGARAVNHSPGLPSRCTHGYESVH